MITATDGAARSLRVAVPDGPRPDKSAELRIWVAIRTDLGPALMPAPKMAVQAAHAAGTCLYLAALADPQAAAAYVAAGQPKILVGAADADALEKLHRSCRDADLFTSIVEDAARTVFSEPTLTAVAVGPCLFGDLPKPFKRLRLFPSQDATERPAKDDA